MAGTDSILFIHDLFFIFLPFTRDIGASETGWRTSATNPKLPLLFCCCSDCWETWRKEGALQDFGGFLFFLSPFVYHHFGYQTIGRV